MAEPGHGAWRWSPAKRAAAAAAPPRAAPSTGCCCWLPRTVPAPSGQCRVRIACCCAVVMPFMLCRGPAEGPASAGDRRKNVGGQEPCCAEQPRAHMTLLVCWKCGGHHKSEVECPVIRKKVVRNGSAGPKAVEKG